MLKRHLITSGVGFRFVLTGIMVNGTLFILFAILVRIGVDYRVGASATYLIGMIWGYVQNRVWSWDSRAPIFRSARRYVAVYLGVYILHLGLISALVEVFGLSAIQAGLISICVLIVPIFVALDRFVFARHHT